MANRADAGEARIDDRDELRLNFASIFFVIFYTSDFDWRYTFLNSFQIRVLLFLKNVFYDNFENIENFNGTNIFDL